MSQPTHHDDPRIVMTLDAGGTNLKFSAIRGNALLFAPIYVPSDAHDLPRCLQNIVAGFRQVEARLPGPPVAISFAFPGPADYPAGIISDKLPNFPAFREAGGVALGPLLEAEFKLPVFINNDGNLFAYGGSHRRVPAVRERFARRREQPETVLQPVRRHARDGPGRRHRDRRPPARRRQLQRRRGPFAAPRARLHAHGRGRRVHPRGAARLRASNGHRPRRRPGAENDCRHRAGQRAGRRGGGARGVPAVGRGRRGRARAGARVDRRRGGDRRRDFAGAGVVHAHIGGRDEPALRPAGGRAPESAHRARVQPGRRRPARRILAPPHARDRRARHRVAGRL